MTKQKAAGAAAIWEGVIYMSHHDYALSEHTCQHCGSTSFTERPHELHGAGLYCAQCEHWLRWLGKHRTPEQQAKKAEKMRLYQLEWMSTQEPTAAQLAYLWRLGYQGHVSSRLHAHNLINERAHGGG